MKRITRKRRLTETEAQRAQRARAEVEKEFPPAPPLGLKYVALAYNAWDSIHAVTPIILPISPLGKSTGFMLVYDSLEALRADYPNTAHLVVMPATDILPRKRKTKRP